MPRSGLFSVAIVACLIGGSLGAFTANWPYMQLVNGTMASNETGPFVSAVLVMESATALKAVIRVTVGNLTDYAWTTLGMGNTTDNISTILWVDPIRSNYVDQKNPQTKDIDGTITFEYSFYANQLVGPLGYPGVRMQVLWDALFAGTIYITVATSSNTSALCEHFSPADEYFFAELKGFNNVPAPIETLASGYSMLTISPDYTNATVTLLMSDVQGYYMSHIHAGNDTTNGPPVVWINPTSLSLLGPQYFDVRSASFVVAFNSSQLTGRVFSSRSLSTFAAAARSGNLYGNIHSQAYPNGVARGQFIGSYPVLKA